MSGLWHEDLGTGDPAAVVLSRPRPGCLPLVHGGLATPVAASGGDHPGVLRAVRDLAVDIGRVTGVTPRVDVPGADPSRDGQLLSEAMAAPEMVLVGTIGRSALIDHLVATGRLDVAAVTGRWETSLTQVVERPLPGVERALVIAGSDQRGTIFGVYELSRWMGVSPWYWWDDVTPQRVPALYVPAGRHQLGPPAVRYRGIFINDENPVLGTWAPGHFGPGAAPGHPDGFNRHFYARVFETMLRLRANTCWPAVWGRAFAEDDPANHATATAYGVIMGTSHEAPMMRGIEEWNRHATPCGRDAHGAVVSPGRDAYGGTGEWSFRRNPRAITEYWRDGIRRMVTEGFEGLVTVGMRGNGDLALPDGDSAELMREIVDAQRRIIAEVTGGDPTEVPQVWMAYKEVQDHWDRGLRVPDDVTVVFSDDNWGNLRKLPEPAERDRPGGFGLYYHFDYVGAGRSYKWVDTAGLANTWDQLHQAYAWGIDRLWIVNVGDLKGVELPTQFLLDYAWAPGQWPVRRLEEWELRYAALHFGARHAAAVAEVLHTYARLQALRKPELLNRRIAVDPDAPPGAPGAVLHDDEASPFSLVHHRELERVTAAWQRLARLAGRVGARLGDDHADAWFELVGYQVLATANLYALREAQFTNRYYAGQGRAATNALADAAEARFAEDAALAEHYDTAVAGGKWRGLQCQPHIGYGDVTRYGPQAAWQQPERDGVVLADEIYPPVLRIALPHRPGFGVAVDGCHRWWPDEPTPARLPVLSPYLTGPARTIEVFNRGSVPFDFHARPAADWVLVHPAAGRVDHQVRVEVTVDWSRAPAGSSVVPITVTGPGGARVVVDAPLEHHRPPGHGSAGFVEAGGYLAIDAEHATAVVDAAGIAWRRIPDIGRPAAGDLGASAGMEPFPVTAPSQRPGPGSPRLEYLVTLWRAGPVRVWAHLSPRNGALPGGRLRYAVSFDDDPPRVVDVVAATGADDTAMNPAWARNTSDNVNRTVTTHVIGEPGSHRLIFWMVDPTVVLQRLVVDTGGLRPSHLGPPESRRLG